MLHDIAAGPGRKEALSVDQLIVHRQHQHGQIGSLRMDIAHEFQAVPLRERDVHDDDIRRQRADRGTRLSFRLHLTTNGQIRFGLDHASQALPHDRMVVDDEYAPLHRDAGRAWSARREFHCDQDSGGPTLTPGSRSTLAVSMGNEQWIDAPPSVPVSIVSSPPSICAR